MATPSDPSTPYLLLFRNTGAHVFERLTADQRQQLVEQWNGWFERLVAKGQALEGQPLEMEGRVVKAGPDGRVVDGPFAEAKEAVGGYVRLLARDLEEATAIARQHPALVHGLEIEVRPLLGTCHLGVTATPAATARATATLG